MILSREELLKRLNTDNPLLENLVDRDVQLQPAGVDLTLRRIFKLEGEGRVDFDNVERIVPTGNELPFDRNDWVFLPQGSYIAEYNELINMPLDLAAFGRSRSTLLRSGVEVSSALWDPGYRGRSISLLLVHNEKGIRLKRNARILQLVFVRIHGLSQEGYSGVYQGEGVSNRLEPH